MKQELLYTSVSALLWTAALYHGVTAAESSVARLAVSVSGLGALISDPPGISCPGACEADFPAFSDVELRAKPDKGQELLTWSGDCGSPTHKCRLYMDGDKMVQAAFSADL